MRLGELLKVYLGLYKIKIDTGCDYIYFENSDFEPNYADSIVTGFMANDDGIIEIECEMVGEDDDGNIINYVTGETITEAQEG